VGFKIDGEGRKDLGDSVSRGAAGGLGRLAGAGHWRPGAVPGFGPEGGSAGVLGMLCWSSGCGWRAGTDGALEWLCAV